MENRFTHGRDLLFCARACARILSSSAIRLPVEWVGYLLLSLSILLPNVTLAQDTRTLRGADLKIHGVALNRSLEQPTREKMHIADHCGYEKATASAMPLVGSDGATVIPHFQSKRGVVLLEGYIQGVEPKVLHTALLSTYKNLPTAIRGEIAMQPSPRYNLAIALAATVAGDGDLALAKGDFLTLQTDGQIYVYSLPEITVPSEGLVTLFAGTDDSLYFDAALTHLAHSGSCLDRKPHDGQFNPAKGFLSK